MAQDITVAGASFSDVPAILVPKIGSGTATFLDTTISSSAASAGDIASGKLAYVNGSLITGTGSGGSGGYSKTLICPQQTFTGDGQRRATLTGMTSGLVDGAYYIVTYDGTEWLTTCETLWSTNLSIGEVQWFLTTLDSVYPFGVIWEAGTTATVAAANTSQHTIKIEKLEFVGDPSLISKTITANGTYNASTDNVDGYSSVTVNVSGGGSSWTLVTTGTLKVNTTSTTAASAGSLECGSGIFTATDVIWVHIRGQSGKRAGYFYGSDAILINNYAKNGATTTFSAPAVEYIRVNSDGTYGVASGSYGVYAYSVTSGGSLTIRRRYNSANTLTINDTFNISVYKLSMPSGQTLFA